MRAIELTDGSREFIFDSSMKNDILRIVSDRLGMDMENLMREWMDETDDRAEDKAFVNCLDTSIKRFDHFLKDYQDLLKMLENLKPYLKDEGDFPKSDKIIYLVNQIYGRMKELRQDDYEELRFYKVSV